MTDQELNERVWAAQGWRECDYCKPKEWRWWRNEAQAYHDSHRTGPPEYSTEMAAAWELVDEISGRFRLVRQPAGTRWHIDLTNGQTVFGDTAPEAICNAYLAVHGETE